MTVDDPTEPELRAVFGPRADYYLKHWHGTATRHLNWAAVFLSGFWLPYRRLYRAALMYWGFVFLWTLVAAVVFSGDRWPEVERWVDRVVTVALAGIVGVLANEWLFERVRSVVASTRALGLSPDEHLRELARRGGTRVSHSLGFFAAFAIFSVVGAVVLEGFGL